ncbi:DNA mismatch repair protein MLH3 isoform X6 [Vitis riparia]|uniref:DNA mismatch repair protein MLH3 isoform X6 n=1 Tax=Vitis riparia TaxID=96939 RepID=UPI00155A6E84|nr:DNA mismatch repair protein MLH3 isoform X6 [Vitis riparia]
MRSIKPLPEAVHSSVRSGIILFDLTRVVEELIYNSLDAGATKVSVSISVGTCYIKVVDDGTGVTRDGLVLLGERYATSKLHHLTEMDAATGSFGFRGEALGSISDVSLLEIVTKTQGRPNGYRKVMKGCKCLYLGIDDDRQDVGTTVVVRDLFYNQPVRRKYLQSSPKKVLHSVKKCVFRIALVHSNVSFKVVDIESDDELLCTKSSSSPLSLLISGLGIEDSSSLHELNITDGILKLSGYVSGPCNTFSIKAFQYVYINSRFICKGPIHKLLNQLATGFKSFDPWKASSGSQDKKRSRCQGYPTYILNLRCPQSHYDLTFEPSRTAVEFKDWVPILAFLEKAVTRFWSEHIAHGESSMHANKTSGKELLKEHGNVVSAEEETDELKHPLQSSGACNQYFKPSLLEDPLFYGRSDVKKMLENEPDMDKIQNIDIFRKSQCLHIDDDSYSFEDFTTKEATDLMNSESKWRNNCPKIASGDKSQKFNDQYNVLDISSGILHLAGDSLIPQSITKNCLQDAKVLQQVDKKFIPVVADGTLAIIDQHAADERIRLEELRQKVLSGEVKTITYLDAEQELVLPEIGYQLLHTYAEQIQNWGWICNIHAQNSRSFTKNLDLSTKSQLLSHFLQYPVF